MSLIDTVNKAIAAKDGFDAACYLQRYPDVAEKFNIDNAATHWVKYGKGEGRIPGCAAQTTSGGAQANNTASTQNNTATGTNQTQTTNTSTNIPAPVKSSPAMKYILIGVGIVAVVTTILIVIKRKQ